MKHRILPLILIALLSVTAAGCAGAVVSTESPTSATGARVFSPDWTKAAPARVSGRIWECSDGKLCLISVPKSGARVSYYLFGEKRDELDENYGRYSTVTGKVLPDAGNEWRKYLLVEKIISMSDYPPAGYFR